MPWSPTVITVRSTFLYNAITSLGGSLTSISFPVGFPVGLLAGTVAHGSGSPSVTLTFSGSGPFSAGDGVAMRLATAVARFLIENADGPFINMNGNDYPLDVAALAAVIITFIT